MVVMILICFQDGNSGKTKKDTYANLLNRMGNRQDTKRLFILRQLWNILNVYVLEDCHDVNSSIPLANAVPFSEAPGEKSCLAPDIHIVSCSPHGRTDNIVIASRLVVVCGIIRPENDHCGCQIKDRCTLLHCQGYVQHFWLNEPFEVGI
jgi:hypothetical protein